MLNSYKLTKLFMFLLLINTLLIAKSHAVVGNQTSLAAAPLHAYITNYQTSTISKCMINSSGDISNCVDSGATNIVNPNSIVINSAGTYAYIVNNAQNFQQRIVRCSIDSTGDLSECININGDSDRDVHPRQVILNEIGTHAYMYSIGLGFNNKSYINKCIIDQESTPMDCDYIYPVNNIDTIYPSLTFFKSGSITYAYFNGHGGFSVFKCIVDETTGSFNNCESNIFVDAYNPISLANSTSVINRIFVLNKGSGNFPSPSISICFLSGSNGKTGSCDGPYYNTIAIKDPNSITAAVINGTTYLYTLGRNNEIMKCRPDILTLNYNNNCSINTDLKLNNPTSIFIK